MASSQSFTVIKVTRKHQGQDIYDELKVTPTPPPAWTSSGTFSVKPGSVKVNEVITVKRVTKRPRLDGEVIVIQVSEIRRADGKVVSSE